MPAINFKKQSAPAVESGEKKQTIRALRKDGRPSATVGGPLMLYTGMRTKVCRKLKDAVCKSVSPVLIKEYGPGIEVFIDGAMILNTHDFAKADGFKSEVEFFDFFEKTHGLPFEGVLIEWD